jgi:hypothetical protein
MVNSPVSGHGQVAVKAIGAVVESMGLGEVAADRAFRWAGQGNW